MEKIYLENFTNINHFESNLSSVLIFSGSNFEIKANLARIIALFRNWEFQGKLLDYRSLFERFSTRDLLMPSSRIEYESDMRKIFFNGEYFEVKSKISDIDENIRSEEIFKKQVIDIVQEALNEGSKTKNTEYLYNKLSKLKVNINSMVIIPSLRSTISALSETLATLKGVNLPLQNNLMDFLGRWKLAREELKKCNLEPFGGNYVFEDKEDRIYENKQFISRLNESSSVVQSILPLKLVLEYYNMISVRNQKTSIKDLKRISYLVEEPELHLHPDKFPYIVRLILESCELSVNDLIVTTNHEKISQLIKEGSSEALEFVFQNNEIVKQ